MKTIKRYKAIDSAKLANIIFILCWIAYFSTYIGRLNYSAAMTQMIDESFLSKVQGGLIGTSFFACYGVGQFFNGFIGDRVSPFKMIFGGILVSAIANLFMALFPSITLMYVIWGLNGIAQSMIWSPIMRIFSQLLPIDRRFKACVHINSTVAAGTLCAYLLSTLLLGLSNWKSVFIVAGIFLFIVALAWGAYFLKTRNNFKLEEVAVTPEKSENSTGLVTILFASGVFLMLFPTAIHGMLKDGITSWFPSYLVENHGLMPNISVLLTTILPLFNLTGAYLANWLNNKLLRSDLKTAGLMFLLSGVSLALLAVFGGYSIFLAIILTAIATSSMFGVNAIMVSILPMYFGKVGLASTVTGILNSATYIGCAISMGLFGAMIE
ncbi:MAG: MFS transporter, partial [Oscillospiraceae bacterium]